MGVKFGSLTLKEEHSVRSSVNRMLRSIFGPKMEEGTGNWRSLHN
jgi:hypothetical protein